MQLTTADDHAPRKVDSTHSSACKALANRWDRQMTRITQRDLAGAVKRLHGNLTDTGILRGGEVLHLDHGSKVNGNSYRLWIGDAETYHGWQPFGTFHFGFTAREAFNALHALSCGIEAVRYSSRVNVTPK